MKVNLEEIVLPTSEMIVNSKHRFNLFGPSITDTEGLLLKTLRALNKVRDVSVVDYDTWSNYMEEVDYTSSGSPMTSAVYLLVKEDHVIYKNINILSPLGRDVDYNYEPIKVKIDGSRKKSVAIKVEYVSDDNDLVISRLEQIINILGDKK